MKPLKVIISKMEKLISQIISLEKQLYESFIKLEKLNDVEQKRKELKVVIDERQAKIAYLRKVIAEKTQKIDFLLKKESDCLNKIAYLRKRIDESSKSNNFLRNRLEIASQKNQELTQDAESKAELLNTKNSLIRSYQLNEIESLKSRCVYLKSLRKPSLKDTLEVISMFFDASYYSKSYGVNKRLSKLHFFFIGRRKFYNITPYVDLNFLKNHYGIVELDIINYLKTGVPLGINPNEYFSSNWYRKKNSDLEANLDNPLDHYVKHGWKKLYSPSLAFNIQKYLDHHEDVKIAGVEPLKHFLTRGAVERREVFKHD